METGKEMMAGFCSAVVRFSIFFPLESVKIRIQEDPEKYPTPRKALRVICREEGIRALYRGVAFPMGAASLVSCLQFGALHRANYIWTSGLSQLMAVGGCIGVVSSLVSCPIDQALICKQLLPQPR